MTRLADDLRLALRGLRRTPTFAVTAVLILGIAIGMTSAMATVYDAVLRRPLPVREQDRIVLPRTLDARGMELALWTDEMVTLRRESRALRAVSGVVHWGAPEAPMFDGDRALVLHRAVVDGGFFDVLGARPALGRLLGPADDVTGGPDVMVVSYAAWRRDFGGDPGIVGRRITEPYTRGRYTILGVAPAGLDYPAGVDYWMPAMPRFGKQLMTVVGRLAPGARPDDARAEMLAFTRRLDTQRQLPFKPVAADARTFPQVVVGDVRPMLALLGAAVALLLLIACVNVGNLLLLRGAARARELVIRRAIGASVGAVVRLLVVESAVLALTGGALGVVCASALLRVLLAAAPTRLPRTDVVALAGPPLAVAAAVTLLAVLVFGVLPAIVAARVDVAGPLRGDARSGTETRRRHALRRGLVVSQLALAVVVLAGAGLVTRSLRRLETQPFGFAREHLSFVSVSMPMARYASDTQRVALGEAIEARARAIPGVVALSRVAVPPFVGEDVFITKAQAEGAATADGDQGQYTPFDMVGPDYFHTFRIPIVRGRAFTPADRDGAPHVVVISESVARRHWPAGDPLGRRIVLGGEPWTVVGVARDTHFRTARDAGPMIYYPTAQSFFWQGVLAVRTSGALDAVLPALRGALREVDPQLGIWRAQTMDDLLAEPLAQPRLGTFVLSGFGLVALLLAAIGLYGVLASAVRERTREIGVRMSLGATPARLRGEVLRQALVVCGAGTAIGLAGALATSRLLTSLLFQVSPTDPVALLGACLLLMAVAMIAAYVPARRATLVDPARTLRAE